MLWDAVFSDLIELVADVAPDLGGGLDQRFHASGLLLLPGGGLGSCLRLVYTAPGLGVLTSTSLGSASCCFRMAESAVSEDAAPGLDQQLLSYSLLLLQGVGFGDLLRLVGDVAPSLEVLTNVSSTPISLAAVPGAEESS